MREDVWLVTKKNRINAMAFFVVANRRRDVLHSLQHRNLLQLCPDVLCPLKMCSTFISRNNHQCHIMREDDGSLTRNPSLCWLHAVYVSSLARFGNVGQ